MFTASSIYCSVIAVAIAKIIETMKKKSRHVETKPKLF